MNDLQTLKELESKQNSGRGVQCVKYIIVCIERGMMEEAEAAALNEQDKIRSYPVLKASLRKLLPEYDAWHKRQEKLFGPVNP